MSGPVWSRWCADWDKARKATGSNVEATRRATAPLVVVQLLTPRRTVMPQYRGRPPGAHRGRRVVTLASIDTPRAVATARVELLAKVRINEHGCWIWQGRVHSGGYAMVGRGQYTHVVAYELWIGPRPVGMQLDHICHTEAVAAGACDGGNSCLHRRCVNPEHLELVTPAENTRRSSPNNIPNVNARKTHCLRGHEFTPENTRFRRGARECRECIRIRRAVGPWR